MPMYDFKCEEDHLSEALRPLGTQEIPCPTCGKVATKVWMSHTPAVIGDACDIHQENGFPTVQHFTSKSERRRALKEAGIQEMHRHVGVPGTDKSPHTTLWSAISAETLANAKAMLERVGGIRPSTTTEEDLDDAVAVGEVAVPILTTGGGRTIAVHIGKVYSGTLDPDVLLNHMKERDGEA